MNSFFSLKMNYCLCSNNIYRTLLSFIQCLQIGILRHLFVVLIRYAFDLPQYFKTKRQYSFYKSVEELFCRVKWLNGPFCDPQSHYPLFFLSKTFRFLRHQKDVGHNFVCKAFLANSFAWRNNGKSSICTPSHYVYKKHFITLFWPF